MVNKITKKAILDIKKNIDSYGKEMSAISEKIATVDEKYRKLAEKETKELRESYAVLEEEQEIWNSSLSRYDADVVNEVLGNASTTDDENSDNITVETTTEEVKDEEPKVVDTIFEENNMEDEQAAEFAESTTEHEEETIFPEAEMKTEMLENVNANEWKEETEEDIAEPPVTNVAEEEEWPEFPENWQHMGYYTYYQIAFVGDDDKVKAFKDDLLETSKDYDGEVDSYLEDLLSYSGVEATLYDLEDWIDTVAPRHPDVIVILNGDGEESYDLWESRWKGDKYEHQEAVIPPFTTPELLTEREKQNNN